MTESEPTMAINPGNKSDSGDSRQHSTLGGFDPWEVAKVAAEDHFLPRMDGTVAPDHVQQAFIDGYAGAVEQLPSRDEIAAAAARGTWEHMSDMDRDVCLEDADAVLALIRECYEGA